MSHVRYMDEYIGVCVLVCRGYGHTYGVATVSKIEDR